MVDKILEFSNNEITIIGLVLIALMSLIYTNPLSLYVVIPTVSILLTKIILSEIKNYKKR